MNSSASLGTPYAKEETGRERRTRSARKLEAWLVLENAPLYLSCPAGATNRETNGEVTGLFFIPCGYISVTRITSRRLSLRAVEVTRFSCGCIVWNCWTAVHRILGAAHTNALREREAQRWRLRLPDSRWHPQRLCHPPRQSPTSAFLSAGKRVRVRERPKELDQVSIKSSPFIGRVTGQAGSWTPGTSL